MKGLVELTAENLVARAEAKRKASLRRLKQRIANIAYFVHYQSGRDMRRDINAAIDAWDAAERKRGMR